MTFINIAGKDFSSYPTASIDVDAILQELRDAGAVDVDSPSLYAGDGIDTVKAITEAGLIFPVDEIELSEEVASARWDNTCNHETAYDQSIQFATVDIGNGSDCYDETLILIETRSGDPRGAYSNQMAFVGVLAETGLLSATIGALTVEHDLADAINPSYVGGSCALQNLIDLHDNDQMPTDSEGDEYALVLDDSGCPCFDGDSIQVSTPAGDIVNVSFYWEGEHAC